MENSKKKPFWDVEENNGFINVQAWDGISYKVWNQGTREILQKVADTLANVRHDLNKLLVYIYTHPQDWKDHPIAYGIYHTFKLHTPNMKHDDFLKENAMEIINSGRDLFNYQEMTPNNLGILGLNKPKQMVNVPLILDGKKIYYELATRRSIFLTIRPKVSSGKGQPDVFDSYSKILDLAIHEITHTTCNDTRWKPDNHKQPYPEYHEIMRKFAKECGILKSKK